eukprot:4972738-Amphidinium_carterae.1
MATEANNQDCELETTNFLFARMRSRTFCGSICKARQVRAGDSTASTKGLRTWRCDNKSATRLLQAVPPGGAWGEVLSAAAQHNSEVAPALEDKALDCPITASLGFSCSAARTTFSNDRAGRLCATHSYSASQECMQRATKA